MIELHQKTIQEKSHFANQQPPVLKMALLTTVHLSSPRVSAKPPKTALKSLLLC